VQRVIDSPMWLMSDWIDLAHSSVGSRMVIVHHVMPGWRWRRCDNGVDAAQRCQ